MRTAQVFYKEILAGIIAENDDGYIFRYDDVYLNKVNSKPVSLTLPLRQLSYESKVLFSFFDGLIPEGWLLNIAASNWKINRRDRFGLLLALCKDCIGCVSVVPKEDK
ncbi:HipA N-terminal domain-containing protein [Arachidicoccus sp.]|jgi:serine/threonine-protein kinase HipA|uniref:HipA N-terminal domain-containing protein n=1 Tax=Arachidicoccus sp. TaxID=1872624 RepID=UPI003D24CB6B